MRKLSLIIFCLICLALHSETFRKTYHRTPLIEVLHDVEKHFGCSFLYRPQDLANAPVVTGSFSTDNYTDVLNKALGNQLVYTIRNNICVITPAPQQTHIPKVTAHIPLPHAEIVQEEKPKHEALEPALSDARIVLSPRKAVHFKRSGKVPPPRLRKSHYLKHSFYTTLSLGYGSELYTGLSAQYAWFFKPHWGLSLGLDAAYAKPRDDVYHSQEVRIGIPISFHTLWQLAPKWGIHANVGVNLAHFNIPVEGTRYCATAALHATRYINKHVLLQLGFYTNLDLPYADLWSVGAQLGFQIGK